MKERITSVLVVDDNPDIREALYDTLTVAGYRVLLATDGQHALDCVRKTPPPCLILLDLMMPVMDGWEFLRQLHDMPACGRYPVIVMSASADAKESLRMPCVVDLLNKPFDMPQLLDVVKAYASAIGG